MTNENRNTSIIYLLTLQVLRSSDVSLSRKQFFIHQNLCPIKKQREEEEDFVSHHRHLNLLIRSQTVEMDRSLPENHRFRLNEDTYSNNDGKFYVFVKLTDSCMQTIETYLKSNKKSNLSIKSNILFNQHGGVITNLFKNYNKKTNDFLLKRIYPFQ